MKDRSPAIQFYFRQFSGDEHVLSMTLQEIGCHILLMCAAGASKERYRLVNDQKVLRSICRNIRCSTWGPIYQSLTRGAWKISKNGKWIEQDGLKRSFLKQKDFSNIQREKAKKRWDAPALPLHRSGNAEGMPASASASASASTSTKQTGGVALGFENIKGVAFTTESDRPKTQNVLKPKTEKQKTNSWPEWTIPKYDPKWYQD